MKPSLGRIVHYRKREGGPCQAAVIVKVWSDTTVNLVVFRDGSNDSSADGHGGELVSWATSATLESESQHAHTWHAPERVEG